MQKFIVQQENGAIRPQENTIQKNEGKIRGIRKENGTFRERKEKLFFAFKPLISFVQNVPNELFFRNQQKSASICSLF